MPHEVSLIATIAAGFGLALGLGYLAALLRMPPLVGYLAAGIMIGPNTPGFVGDLSLAAQLAEIGVMLLMFGVGLHFSVADLMAARRVAVPGAAVQITTAVLMGAATATAWGWPLGGALVFGLCLSVASTVVLLRTLEARNLIESINGRIAIGWLVVEDLIMVLALVLLPALAGLASHLDHGDAITGSLEHLGAAVGITLGKVVAFIALMLVVGKRILPWLLLRVARTGSRELFTLCVIAAGIGVAFGAALLFDVSFALGAFFAGMMLRESEFSHRAANESLPLRDAFAVLFFVSVGMLFDPAIIIDAPLKLLAVLAIILIGKTIAAVVLTLIFRYPLNTALAVGASLAQIGEFSFILAGLGVALGLLPEEGRSLILAGALVSIAANSAIFALLELLHRWVVAHSRIARRLEARADPTAQLPADTTAEYLSNQIVLVGHGRTGEQVARSLARPDVPLVIVEQDREIVESLRERGMAAVSGDASTPEVLIQAHIARASLLVIAVPNMLHIQRIIEIARQLNPDVRVIARAYGATAARILRRDFQVTAFVAEETLAESMSAHVVNQFHPRAASTSATTQPSAEHVN